MKFLNIYKWILLIGFFFGFILGSVVLYFVRDSLEKLFIYLDMGKLDKNFFNVLI